MNGPTSSLTSRPAPAAGGPPRQASSAFTRAPGVPDDRGGHDVLEQLFLLVRTYASHGTDHPLTAKLAAALQAAIEATNLSVSFQFIGQAAFRDRVLLPCDSDGFQRIQFLGHALHNLGVHELSFESVPDLPGLIQLAELVGKGTYGPSEALLDASIPGVEWREIPNAHWGTDGNAVDPEVFAAAQLALAIADAELLFGRRDPWDWSLGMSIVRRVERMLAVGGRAVFRALEIAPGAWSLARRAVAACLHAQAVARNIHMGLSSGRAVTHPVLILAVHGFKDRGGEDARVVAARALQAALSAPALSRSGIEPHRLRATAVLHCLQPGAGARHPGVEPLVRLSYDLERLRCAPNVTFSLTAGDLLAWLVGQADRQYPAAWVRAMLEAHGHVPVGSHVRLVDGRIGIVLDCDPADPLRPRILVGKSVLIPDRPVTLVSAAQTQREAHSR